MGIKDKVKILIINETCGTGSHGKICAEMAEEYSSQGHEVKIAYGRNGDVPEKYRKYAVRIGTKADVYVHALYTRITDKHGFGSLRATKQFIQWAKEYSPDLLWLHNLHGYYIHIEILFRWIKENPNMQIKWTLHDCWAFTGHCSHYLVPKCSKWKKQCYQCPEKRQYPKSLFADTSAENYKRKRLAFTGVNNMMLITPSVWLAEEVKQSFLRCYPVKVVHNKINKNEFKPTKSNFRQRYCLEDKRIVLGVASRWTDRKGFGDFIRLSRLLDKNYVIVLVGVDQKQRRKLPQNMIGIERTENKEELAGIYSASDIFVNLTYEENYPTVNLEAEACGTPVVTYDTGGCRETIRNEYSRVVKTGDWEEVLRLIKECLRE